MSILKEVNENIPTDKEDLLEVSNREGKRHADEMIKVAERLAKRNPEWVVDIMLDRMREEFKSRKIKSSVRIGEYKD